MGENFFLLKDQQRINRETTVPVFTWTLSENEKVSPENSITTRLPSNGVRLNSPPLAHEEREDPRQ